MIPCKLHGVSNGLRINYKSTHKQTDKQTFSEHSIPFTTVCGWSKPENIYKYV